MKDDFTAVEICSIIKTCGESQVSSISLGKLKIEFKISPEVIIPTEPPVGFIALNQEPVSEHDHAQLESDREQSEQDVLDHMLITDPVGYEQRLLGETSGRKEGSQSQ